jgi:DNA-binding response OmpR family regulator
MMNKISVLLVEDEPVLAAIIKESLETRDFIVHIAGNGNNGWSLFKKLKPDICIIDVMLPGRDGFSLVADIRTVDEKVPVIFLTARKQPEDVIHGLEIGADDYMKKPFSMEELVLRLKVMVRRQHQFSAVRNSSSGVVKVGGFMFNMQKQELTAEEQVIQLSQREADLLRLLIEVKNELLDRKTALLKLWGDDDPFAARSMDVYITRIRKYFREDASIEIINIRGKGYSLIEYS